MTESQKRFLTSYLGEEWKGDIVDGICERCGTVFSVNRTFTEPKDKQDLLEALMAKGEWDNFLNIAYAEYSIEFPLVEPALKRRHSYSFTIDHYYKWLILLPPEETAELICKWKGVE